MLLICVFQCVFRELLQSTHSKCEKVILDTSSWILAKQSVISVDINTHAQTHMSLGVTYYDQNFNNVNNAAYDTRYVVKSRKSITNVQRHTLRLTFSAICD